MSTNPSRRPSPTRVSGSDAARQQPAASRLGELRALRAMIETNPALLIEVRHTIDRSQLFDRARALDDLPLAVRVGQHRHARGEATLDENVDLGVALWRMGRIDAALDLVHGLRIRHPRAQRPAGLHRRILAWARETDAWADARNEDSALYLEPLGHHHLDDFVQAYADPAIAARCCLPRFRSSAHWHAWLDDAHPDQATFGVWSRTWGFLGSVSLALIDGVGFFYYWLNRDFRGHGLGPRAGALLLERARREAGMHSCYAKVFVDNTPSRRGLEKLGFTPIALPIRGEPGAEMLYRWSARPDMPLADALASEVRALFDALGGNTRVLRPIVRAPRRPPTSPRRHAGRGAPRNRHRGNAHAR